MGEPQRSQTIGGFPFACTTGASFPCVRCSDAADSSGPVELKRAGRRPIGIALLAAPTGSITPHTGVVGVTADADTTDPKLVWSG